MQKSVRARQGDTVAVGSGVAISQPIEVELSMPSVIRQGYLAIRDVATSEVVTVLEVLSPTNKCPGEGRLTYVAKRQTILASAINFVEIDLLRQWTPLIEAPEALAAHYRILVSVSAQRPRADLSIFNLQNPIPVFPLPLGTDDPEPSVDLKGLIRRNLRPVWL